MEVELRYAYASSPRAEQFGRPGFYLCQQRVPGRGAEKIIHPDTFPTVAAAERFAQAGGYEIKPHTYR